MKRLFCQWAVLSACVLLIYHRAYGRTGVWHAFFFLLCIGVFLWILNKGDPGDQD